MKMRDVRACVRACVRASVCLRDCPFSCACVVQLRTRALAPVS